MNIGSFLSAGVRSLLFVHCLAGALLAPVFAQSAPLRISGTVSYRERIAMPPGYVVKVQLLDIARQDAAAETLAEVEITPKHQPPVPFLLTLDESRLDPRARYSVRAQIYVGDRMLFTSTRINPVTPGAAPRKMNIMVQRIAAP